MKIESRVTFLYELALPLAFSWVDDVIVVNGVIDVVVVVGVIDVVVVVGIIDVVYRNDNIVIYIVNIVNQAVW